MTKFLHTTPNSNKGGILKIGPASVSIDNANLRTFVDAVREVEAMRYQSGFDSNSPLVANAALLDGTDWGPIAYVSERDSYNVRYRGVCWEASAATVIAVASEVEAYLVSTPEAV